MTYAQAPAIRGVGQPTEYEVKAAFLLNFTKFIQWPADAGSANAPFTICLLGEDPFGRTLDDIVEGEKVAGRPLTVRRLNGPSAGPCEILFVSRSVRDVEATLAEFHSGVLTVGDSDRFLSQGGMIAFVLDNQRVRFDVNTRSVSSGGLKISSRLLNVARSVVEKQVRP